MAYGMSYDDFWHADTEMHAAYREAARIKLENENYNAWLIGAYVHNAVGVVIGNAFKTKSAPAQKYMKPLDILPKKKTAATDEEAEKQAELQELCRQHDAMAAIAQRFNAQRKDEDGGSGY